MSRLTELLSRIKAKDPKIEAENMRQAEADVAAKVFIKPDG